MSQASQAAKKMLGVEGGGKGAEPVQDHAQTAIVHKVRQVINAHSGGGIKGIAHIFQRLDYQGRKKLDSNDVMSGLKDYKIKLTKEESDKLVAAFDRTGDKVITYDMFLLGIRGEMSEMRKAVCLRAYAKLDVTKDGKVDMNDIRRLYNAKFDPRVKNGSKTEDQVLLEFMNVFEGAKGNRDGVVSPNEWFDYYSSVSASVDTDEYFVDLVKRAWKLDQYDVEYEKGWAQKDSDVSLASYYKSSNLSSSG